MKTDNEISNYENGTDLFMYQKVGVFNDGIERNYIGKGKVTTFKGQQVIIVGQKTEKWQYGNENVLTQERINIREIKITDIELEKDDEGSPIF